MAIITPVATIVNVPMSQRCIEIISARISLTAFSIFSFNSFITSPRMSDNALQPPLMGLQAAVVFPSGLIISCPLSYLYDIIHS